MSNITFKKGDNIPQIGFGTWLLSGNDCINAVYEAIKAGYRIIDTAEGYANEAEVGYAIAKAISEGICKREELFIATKLSVHHPIGYENTLHYFEKSLKNLNLDYLDLYLIHYPNSQADDSWKTLNAETWRAMEKLHEEGKLRYLGCSNFMPYHIKELLKTAKIKPVCNQIELNPAWQQEHVVEYCRKNDINLIAWRPLMSRSWAMEKDFMKKLPTKYNKSIQQILLRWSIQKGYTPLTRSTKPNRMKENMEIFDFELAQEDMDTLDSLQCSSDVISDNSHVLWSLWEQVLNKEYLRKEKIKLFGFIPFIKIKYFGKPVYKLKYYLWGIPVLKRKIINKKLDKLYLFGIRIAIIKKYYEQDKVVSWIPNYNSENLKSDTEKNVLVKTNKRSKIKYNWFTDKIINPIIFRGDFWKENYQKKPFFKLYLIIRYLLKRKVSIPSLDIHITTHCSLKCKNCSHMIPYYKPENQHTMTLEEFKSNIDAILKNVDIVYNINILGGEPLLNKAMTDMLEYANSKNRIKGLRIHTNGTIMPKEDDFLRIKNLSKVCFYFSNYSGNKSIKSIKQEQIIEKLNEYNIKYFVEVSSVENRSWFRMPEMDLKQDISDEQNIRQYQKCNFRYCPCLSNNKIYPCALAKYIADSGYILKDADYIDLTNKQLSSKEFINFYSSNSYNICKCCNFENYGSILFPAIQLNSNI